MEDYQQHLANLLILAGQQGASDIHFSVGRRPSLRVDGNLIEIAKEPVLTPDSVAALISGLLTPEQQDRLIKEREIDFAFNWFLSQKQNIINLSYGGGQPNISQDVVRSIRIPLPPSKEQHEIIEFIKSETFTIDTLISKYQKQIDLMQEYRTALISQTVTGKIDVRDWQPKKQQTI